MGTGEGWVRGLGGRGGGEGEGGGIGGGMRQRRGGGGGEGREGVPHPPPRHKFLQINCLSLGIGSRVKQKVLTARTSHTC